VVEAATYEEANHRCRELTGQGLSRQSFALAGKILDVERSRGEAGARLYEVHPKSRSGPWPVPATSWSAQRIAAGTAHSLPDPPDQDPVGRDVAIWY
jgi:predicted RNase H-like nuclease